MKKKAIIVSGYFNPIHKGHLEYFNNARALADELFVIVNSDFQRALKGSKEFQKEEERLFIVQNIKAVDKAFISIDKDRTVCESIRFIYENNNSIPEAPTCKELNIELIDGLGDKIQSSSWLLNKQ